MTETPMQVRSAARRWAEKYFNSKPGEVVLFELIAEAIMEDRRQSLKLHGLTKDQARTLRFIADVIERTGSPPSYQEIAEEIGLASKSGVVRLIAALEDRGAIVRLPHKARSIAVVRGTSR